MSRRLAMLLREKLEAYHLQRDQRANRALLRAKARRSRLHLEGLEDRALLSVASAALPPVLPPVMTAAAMLYNDAIKTVETAISTHQHLGDSFRARLESALQHHQQTVTPFIGPYIVQPDKLTWDPPDLADLNASNPKNWLLNGAVQAANGKIPGDSPTDIVQFDPSVTLNGRHGNANIMRVNSG